MPSTLVIHTNELVLKGSNRSTFERRLAETLTARLRGIADLKLERRDGSVMMFEAPSALTDAETAAVSDVVRRTFGVASFLFAAACGRDLAAVQAAALAAVAGRTGTFKVETSRRDKTYLMPSMEMSREVGHFILENRPDLKVDVHAPDTTVRVEVDYAKAYVSAAKEPGPGGLPTGVSGRVACLLSGGIDSPVAAWKLMRRGCEATMVHCHSYPHVGRESIDKVERLAETLAAWQGETRLWLVPLAEAQREVVAKCDESYRVVLYRRLMLRAAEALGRREGCQALVTGDAVGQVASQTLENLACVSEAATMPIFRPLIGDDKGDIMDAARRLGTYDISIEKHDDCCSLFMPRHPETKGRLARVLAEEAKLDVPRLVEEMVKKSELRVVSGRSKQVTEH